MESWTRQHCIFPVKSCFMYKEFGDSVQLSVWQRFGFMEYEQENENLNCKI